MTMAGATDTVVLRCDLDWEDIREVMATSRLLILIRRSWLVAGIMFGALLAESIALLRVVVTRPASYGAHRGPLLGELIAGATLCLLLVVWSALRVWRLSPGRQARHALASGVWQSGMHEYKLRDEGMAWRAPDRSAVFLPWSALTGVRETERMFLLLDQEGRHVRGFVPKAAQADLPPHVELGRLLRDRITAVTSLSARLVVICAACDYLHGLWLSARLVPQQTAAVAHAGEQAAGEQPVPAADLERGAAGRPRG
jgi:hypothetical protein